MQFIEVPDFQRLSGEKAIKALHDFVDELEEQRGKELTDKQTTVLIKVVRGLISSIEAEKRLNPSDKDFKEVRFVSQFKRTIMKYVPESFQIHEDGRLRKLIR